MLPGTGVSGNHSGESKTRVQWHLVSCGMQFICSDENKYKLFCITEPWRQ